ERERDPDASRLRHRVGGAHHAVDDPRLAAHLGDDPAALERDDRRDAREGARAKEPLRLRDVAPSPPDEPEPGAETDQHGADPDPRVEALVQYGVSRLP